jgi:hypothetical protein
VRRIANIRPDGIVAVLVLKHAFEDEEFLAASVYVRGEMAFRRVANDGGCSSDLIADAIEHAPFDTRHG